MASIMDMLPDELPQAEITPYTRSGMPVCVGLHAYKCAICKKAFEATTEHAYKLRGRNGGKMKMYCSYTCFRVDEKPLLEKKKRAALRRWSADDYETPATPREKAERELSRCREKRKHWAAIKADKAQWDELPWYTQRSVEDKIAMWLAREIVAEQVLEELEKGG